MHILRVPSFFLTNKIGAPHGDILSWMKPLSSRSLNITSTLPVQMDPFYREEQKLDWCWDISQHQSKFNVQEGFMLNPPERTL